MIPSYNKKRKLLAFDDSVENLKLLIELLGKEYDLVVAKNGKKALEIIASNPSIDLILLDVIMPGEMHGFEVCKTIKSNPSHSHIPVIFLTGLNDSEDETLGLKLGGADYITKPFQPDVVKARISTQLKLKEEQEKTKKLLQILLPDNVIQELNKSGTYTPIVHDSVSILFSDLVGFTEISSQLSPQELVDELSRIFTAFDQIMKKNNCIRIKTIGDGYMAACGVKNEENHANNMVQAGLEIIEYLKSSSVGLIEWKCRIGVNTGKVISGLIGTQRFQFDLLGDDVNIASRIESSAPSMKLCVSKSTVDCLDTNKFGITSIGYKELKGKGAIELFSIRSLP